MPNMIMDNQSDVVWPAKRCAADGELDVDDPRGLNDERRRPGKIWYPHAGICMARFRSYDPRLGRYLPLSPHCPTRGNKRYAHRSSPLLCHNFYRG